MLALPFRANKAGPILTSGQRSGSDHWYVQLARRSTWPFERTGAKLSPTTRRPILHHGPFNRGAGRAPARSPPNTLH